MRLVLLVTLFLSVALSQSRVVNGQIVDKDGRISRYEENNANDKVRVYRKPKSKKPFTNLHPLVPNDMPSYKGRTPQEWFDMGVTNLSQLYETGWRLAGGTSPFNGNQILIFGRD